jgi:hypothetical protein
LDKHNNIVPNLIKDSERNCIQKIRKLERLNFITKNPGKSLFQPSLTQISSVASSFGKKMKNLKEIKPIEIKKPKKILKKKLKKNKKKKNEKQIEKQIEKKKSFLILKTPEEIEKTIEKTIEKQIEKPIEKKIEKPNVTIEIENGFIVTKTKVTYFLTTVNKKKIVEEKVQSQNLSPDLL